MNAEEWLVSADPTRMLKHLDRAASHRKVRLFAVAVCERIWGLLTDARSQSAIAALRRSADGRADEEEMEREIRDAGRAARSAVRAIWVSMIGADAAERGSRNIGGLAAIVGLETARAVEAAVETDIPANAHSAAHWSACCVWATRLQNAPATHYAGVAAAYAARVVANPREKREAWDAERAAQCSLLRDIFDHHFRAVTFDPDWLAWNDSCVVRIARSIYDRRTFEEMPILGDAFEDAGCTDAAILDHCRAPGPHVRGCWLLDALLGKE
jgi:hypothetical protein